MLLGKRIVVMIIAALTLSLLVGVVPASALEKSEVKKTHSSMKGTYYTGTRGAGGKLIPGKDIALNRSFMKKNGIKFGDIVYVKATKKKFSGLFRVRDCGCRSGIIDINLTRAQARSTGITSFGVYKAELKIIKKKYQKKYKKLWKERKAVG
jgi:hypothetical protein